MSCQPKRSIDWRSVAVSVAIDTVAVISLKHSAGLFHSIPQTITFNPNYVFSLPREGYRASMEAKVEEFLADQTVRTTITDASIV